MTKQPIDLDALETTATAAQGTTHGQWLADDTARVMVPDEPGNPWDGTLIADVTTVAHAAHIAAMNPDTTLALIAELRAALRDRQLTAEENRGLLAELLDIYPGVPALPVLLAILDERARQDAKWGQQNHADGTGPDTMPLRGPSEFITDRVPARELASLMRTRCNRRFQIGTRPGGEPAGTWRDILLEEVFEALAENDPAKLRTELVQVAAVAVQWAEAIDRRAATAALAEEVPDA